MEAKNLESLVPPLDLCKKIPKGCFDDSAMVWARPGNVGVLVGDDDLWSICGRRQLEDDDEALPAPTLAEIMEELRKTRHFPVVYFDAYKFEEWTVEDMGPGGVTYDKSNPATAALKLWLQMKGVE